MLPSAAFESAKTRAKRPVVSKTLIFIPTYNERENVERMCRELADLRLDADIVFMDDASPDGTGERLDALASEFPRIAVVHREGKLGIGSAHLAGVAYAYDRGYERLVTLDCDFTHSPSLIPSFIAALSNADVVVGSRYMDSGSLPGWTLARKSLTMLGHFLTESVLNIPQDATGAFRVYDLNTIPRALFNLVQSRGYAFFFESLLVLNENGFRIAEVPIKLPARTYGHSKMSVAEVRRSVSTLGSLMLARQMNPQRFRLDAAPAKLNPELVDPQNWNEYWNKKQRKTTATYDAIATVYRNAVIKRRLEQTMRHEFAPGARVLHAGCGSGQVDTGLHQFLDITAVDISDSALKLYKTANPAAHAVEHASIFELPYAEGSFDGAYNLGVVEHFSHEELVRAFRELARVVRPDGKLVVFWPHAYATSVMVLDSAHWILNDVMGKDIRLHPPEYSLVHSKREAGDLLRAGGFELASYYFGPRDLYVQAVVTARRR
jgi:dolichol-phosphate mannosyltransferase